MTAFDFQDGGVEREARAGSERTPAYVHYHDIIPSIEERQRAAGLDIIIDPTVSQHDAIVRLTDEDGREVERIFP